MRVAAAFDGTARRPNLAANRNTLDRIRMRVILSATLLASFGACQSYVAVPVQR